ncbi:SAM-dependent methyltransferase [Candidatus Latescibacterota bacterium]
MNDSRQSQVANITRDYYNSTDADTFYKKIWGGEDIHIGIYNSPNESVSTASRRTVEVMANALPWLNKNARVLDMGSGYGGVARYLAKRFGCLVDCVNISERQNTYNRQLNSSEGLSELIHVHNANFEDIPFDNSSFNVVWSEDAMVHCGNRAKVVSEAERVLLVDGFFIFTDILQIESVPKDVIKPVLARVHLESMGTIDFYKQTAKACGLDFMSFKDMSQHMVIHYKRIYEELDAHFEELLEICSKDYLNNMKEGLNHWIKAGKTGYIIWGLFKFRKSH